MSRSLAIACLALTLAACSAVDARFESPKLPEIPKLGPVPLERITASNFPMSKDVWRVSVKSDGQFDRDIVERAALYHAAELTVKRGYDRFVVQSASVGTQARPLTETLQQTSQLAGTASNVVVPGVGSLLGGGASAVIGGVDRAFSSYGGDIVVRMFKADDPAAVNALDATDILNTYVNELKKPT